MGSEGRQRRVLIIDDEGDFNRALSIYLSDLGLYTSTASRWTDALDRIGHESPDVILINPHMPTVQGETILRFLRQEGNPVPVVVVSDHLELDRIETLNSLGANEFVQKTDAFYQIAQTISKVLPGWSAEDAPIISEEEFQRIVDQRLGELVEGAEEDRKSPEKPAQSRPISAISMPPAASSAPSTVAAGRDSVGPPGATSPPSFAPTNLREPISIPPPPPLPSAEVERQRVRKIRRRRGLGPGSNTRRILTFLFLVCLLAGAVFMAMTMGLSEFVKGGVSTTEIQKQIQKQMQKRK